MTSIEFINWLAYFDTHPYGSEWDDIRMGVLSANICSALTGKRQEVKDHTASYKKTGANKQTPKQQLMILKDFIARSAAWQTQR